MLENILRFLHVLALRWGTLPRLPILVYSKPCVMSQNCKMQNCQWYRENKLNHIFANMEVEEFWKKVWGTSPTSSSSHFFNKTNFEQYLFKCVSLVLLFCGLFLLFLSSKCGMSVSSTTNTLTYKCCSYFKIKFI